MDETISKEQVKLLNQGSISGNIEPKQIDGGIKEIGQKVKDMGPIANAAYVKAMGISYKDSIKSSDIDQITKEMMTPKETVPANMKKMAEVTKTMSEKIGDFGNRIEGVIRKLGPFDMAAISVLSHILINLVGISIKSGVEKDLSEVEKEIYMSSEISK